MKAMEAYKIAKENSHIQQDYKKVIAIINYLSERGMTRYTVGELLSGNGRFLSIFHVPSAVIELLQADGYTVKEYTRKRILYRHETEQKPGFFNKLFCNTQEVKIPIDIENTETVISWDCNEEKNT